MTATMEDLRTKYEVVIGLEVHAQLKTKSKIFSRASAVFGNDHNANVNPVCLGLPGVLPVLNKEVVDMGILTGLALNCNIAKFSKFDRKQYFYPDLPKGYQISQFDMPIAESGFLMVNGKKIRINRVHMEEDAGKLVHSGANGLAGSTSSNVDLNRAGVPLLEIVSEPDLRSAEDARAYMEEIRNIVRYIGVCDGNLEEGSLRCDANVSIRPFGQEEYGTKAEIKNMNSFRAMQRAVETEIDRQIELVEAGERVVQESRLWNEALGITESMRSKEEAHDYRYFPEPDLMPLEITPEWIGGIQSSMPELPAQKRARYQTECGLSEYDAVNIVETMELARYFDRVIELGTNVKAAANWLMGDITAYTKETKLSITETKLTPETLVELITLIDKGTISNHIAKQIIVELLEKGGPVQKLIEEKGLSVIGNQDELKDIVLQVLAENQSQVEKYKSGKPQLFGFFVGQVMKLTKGRANPQMVNDIVQQELDK